MRILSDYIITSGGSFISDEELYHYGIKGMKWGVRRFQNKNGSLTPAGKKRVSNKEIRNEQQRVYNKEYKKLQKEYGIAEKQKQAFTWSIDFTQLHSFENKRTIRVMHGSEFHRFSVKSREIFYSTPYQITTKSDRMGYRLEGEPLELSDRFDLLSEGVTYGTIQVPTSGQPIILMADRQTTGGYPKIGQVISADFPGLAQMQPNAEIRFIEASLEQAETALFKQEKKIANIALGIRLKAQQDG